MVLLGTTECYGGPIVVTYTEGRTTELDGPICPGQRLAITETSVRIMGTTSG